MSATNHTLDTLLPALADKTRIEVGALSPDTNLFSAGLDSLSLMSLVGHLRAAGYAVDFAGLARTPRLSAWVDYLSTREKSISSEPIEALQERSSPRATETAAPFPLSPMQYAYWLGRDPAQPLGGVGAHLYVEFHRAAQAGQAHGHLDVQRLEAAVERLIARHSSLRTQVLRDGQQVHLPNFNGKKLHVHDLRAATPEQVQERLQALRNEFSTQMLNVEAGEVMAVAVSLLPDGGSRFHLDVDFVAVDAVSYRILMRELALLYEEPETALPALPIDYRDCRKASERQWPAVERISGRYWQARLPTLPEGPELPLRQPLGSALRTTRRHFQLDGAQRDALYAHCREHGLTPSVVFSTVLAETLAGWSRLPRFILNVPLFLRPTGRNDVLGLVGDFSSSVMLDMDMRTDIEQAESFIHRAKHVQARLHEDAARSDYGGVQVLRDLGRLRGRQIAAPVVFTSGLNMGELFDPAARRVFGDPIWTISQSPQVLLDAQVTELNGGILVNWDCREEAFIDGTLDAMFAFFRQSVYALAESVVPWRRPMAESLPTARVRGAATNLLAPAEHPAEPPTTPVEMAVAAIWREVLGSAGDNVHQNLFAAGGDSLLAGQLVAQLREVFGADALDLQRMFAAPTIAGLSTAILASGEADQLEHIASVYCEIMELDDDAILAETAR